MVLRKAAFIRYKGQKYLIGSSVGFEEFVIWKLFQRLEPKEKPQGHFEGNIPAEFEEVLISQRKKCNTKNLLVRQLLF